MKIAVLDVETTGLDASRDSVVEIASVLIEDNEIVEQRHSLVNPLRPIPPSASGIHHITDDLVGGAPILRDVLADIVPQDVHYYCAHNAPFDKSFLPTLKSPWIDTCMVARHLVNAPSYSNQTLRYFLGLQLDLPEKGRGAHPHSALYDAVTTAHLLLEFLKQHDANALYTLSNKMVLLKTMPFGKHKGLPIEDVPTDYLEWLAGKEDLSPELIHTIQHSLERR